MITGQFHFKIRTEQSQQLSFCSNQFSMIENSIQSVSIQDESISLKILNLQKMQEEKFQRKSRRSISTKSHNRSSFASSSDEQSKRRNHNVSGKSLLTIQKIPVSYLNQLVSYNRCQNLAKSDFHNRAYGAMFGFLIGDSLGSFLINKPYNEELIIEALMMKGGGAMNTKAGQGTDQWEICYSLCQGLIESKGVYNSNEIAEKYLQWIESNPKDLPALFGIAMGNWTRKKSLGRKIDKDLMGSQLKENSLKNIKHESSLGLVRLIPLTIWGINLQQYEFNQIVREQMTLITPNEFVIETALIYANILKCILTTGNHVLAFNQASTYIYKFGSQKLIELWNSIEEGKEPSMTNFNSSNLKFPLFYAMNELLSFDYDSSCQKKSFISSAINVLSKGFNTDTNCSITLGLIGATIGYNNIPSYYRNKILSSEDNNRKRNKHFSSKRIVDLVSNLIKTGPILLQNL